MLRTIWASNRPEIKNVEAQKKFRCSYKKKCTTWIKFRIAFSAIQFKFCTLGTCQRSQISTLKALLYFIMIDWKILPGVWGSNGHLLQSVLSNPTPKAYRNCLPGRGYEIGTKLAKISQIRDRFDIHWFQNLNLISAVWRVSNVHVNIYNVSQIQNSEKHN